MKKIYLSLAIAMANFSYAQTVDFESFNLQPETFWDGSDLSGTMSISGTDTIYDTTFVFNDVAFENQWTIGQWGGYLSKGWVFSNKTSDTVIGLAGAYNSYAGGGANNTSNYAITFASTPQSFSVANGSEKEFASVQITNSSYAAHSMLLGDSYAKKFGGTTGDDPDWFLLTIVGYNANNDSIGVVNLYLADYRFSDNSQDYIVKDWQSVDLSTLGAVNRIEFRLSSSDVGNWGMNTPAYVVIDELTPASSASISEVSSMNFEVYPNPTSDVLTVSSEVENGTIMVHDLIGKVVLSQNINSNLNVLNVSELPKGVYLVTVSNGTESTTKRFIKK